MSRLRSGANDATASSACASTSPDATAISTAAQASRALARAIMNVRDSSVGGSRKPPLSVSLASGAANATARPYRSGEAIALLPPLQWLCARLIPIGWPDRQTPGDVRRGVGLVA